MLADLRSPRKGCWSVPPVPACTAWLPGSADMCMTQPGLAPSLGVEGGGETCHHCAPWSLWCHALQSCPKARWRVQCLFLVFGAVISWGLGGLCPDLQVPDRLLLPVSQSPLHEGQVRGCLLSWGMVSLGLACGFWVGIRSELGLGSGLSGVYLLQVSF